MSNEAIEWTTQGTPGVDRAHTAKLGEYAVRLWHVGTERPWRGLIERTVASHTVVGVVTSHFGLESAKGSLEKRLRKLAAKKEQGR